MKPRQQFQLAMALQELAPRGRFEAGQEITRTLEHVDLELEVVVRVRRRAKADQVAVWRAAALEQGGRIKDGWPAHDHVGYGCEVYTKRKGLFGKGGDKCRGKVVAAVVVESVLKPNYSFRWICGRHRESHGVDPARILAVLELPPLLLDPLRAEHARLRREREAERDARERAGLCRDCGKVERDRSCPFHHIPLGWPEAGEKATPADAAHALRGQGGAPAGGSEGKRDGEGQDSTGATPVGGAA